MRTIWIGLGAALLAVLIIGGVACGDDEDEDGGGAATATTAADETPPADETPQVAASVEITSPADGATVSSPVTLEISSTGVEIAPAADLVEGAAHYHAFIDQEPVAVGEVVPSDAEDILHFAAGSLVITLEPGEHTVAIALGDNDHTRLDADAATVTLAVEE